MSSGAHTHDESGAHVQDQLFYNLPARDYSVCVIFIFVGKDRFHLYFVPTSGLAGSGILEDEYNMIFKIPRGFSATFELIEVATGGQPADQGKYLVTMQLHPAEGETVMRIFSRDAREKAFTSKSEKEDELPAGICADSEECPGTYSPCRIGQVLRKVEGVCRCVNPQGGGERD